MNVERQTVWKPMGVDNPIHLIGIPVMVLFTGLTLTAYTAERLIQKLRGLKAK